MIESDRLIPDTNAPPDWASRTDEVFCPLCRYNLRGLAVPRCPECGYRFTWAEVLDPRRGTHPYLFEHHPEANVWSYLRTAAGSWRPKRFWSSLHPAQHGRPKRLLLYWFIGVVALIPLSWGLIGSYAWLTVRSVNINLDAAISKNAEQLQGLIDQEGPGLTPAKAQLQQEISSLAKRKIGGKEFLASVRDCRPNFYRIALPLIISPILLWAWLTLAAMLVFQVSMRRAKIRHVHLLRCVIYSFDPLAFSPFIALFGIVFPLVYPYWGRNVGPLNFFNVMYPDQFFVMGIAAPVAGILNGCIRLRAACKYYLRFDWPTGTVLASLIIAALTALLSLFQYNVSLPNLVVQVLVPYFM